MRRDLTTYAPRQGCRGWRHVSSKRRRELLGHPVHHLDESFRPGTRRGRVLTGDQEAVDKNVRLPVGGLGKDAALYLQLVLDEKGHHLGQADRLSSTLVKPVTRLP